MAKKKKQQKTGADFNPGFDFNPKSTPSSLSDFVSEDIKKKVRKVKEELKKIKNTRKAKKGKFAPDSSALEKEVFSSEE